MTCLPEKIWVQRKAGPASVWLVERERASSPWSSSPDIRASGWDLLPCPSVFQTEQAALEGEQGLRTSEDALWKLSNPHPESSCGT